MKEKLLLSLFNKYDYLCRGRHYGSSRNLMCFGFECGDGWYKLLDELFHDLNEIENKHHLGLILVQVKEKYGGLRCYYEYDDHLITVKKNSFYRWLWNSDFKLAYYLRRYIFKGEYYKYYVYDKSEQKLRNVSRQMNHIKERVNKAENESYTICEICGNTNAKLDESRAWIRTLCEQCSKKDQV